MTITATWVPGFEKHESPAGDAGAYTGGPTKLVWHTSETDPGTIDAIARVMERKQHTDVYHVLADTKLRRVVQLLPLNKAASALRRPRVQTNRDSAIQVCIIVRAHDIKNMPPEALAWLGTNVLGPIVRALEPGDLDIDELATFYGDDAGFTLASADARQRFSASQWDNWNGQCGHQHVPDNDHWDPGALNVAAIAKATHKWLGTKPAPAKPPAVRPITHPTLRQGSTGAAVLELQRKLRFACGQVIKMDGAFGPQTKAAVVNVQRFFKLDADGICGPKTWGVVDFCAAWHGVK